MDLEKQACDYRNISVA